MRLNEIQAKLKSSQCFHFPRIWWGGPPRSAGALPCAFAGVARLACLLAFPSLPHFLGKYQFHTLVFPVQCCVDRCLEVGCGSVAMVTSLLLRRLLPSSVATFKAPTLQQSIGLEFNFSPTAEISRLELVFEESLPRKTP